MNMKIEIKTERVSKGTYLIQTMSIPGELLADRERWINFCKTHGVMFWEEISVAGPLFPHDLHPIRMYIRCPEVSAPVETAEVSRWRSAVTRR
jgi:hypothetical protein